MTFLLSLYKCFISAQSWRLRHDTDPHLPQRQPDNIWPRFQLQGGLTSGLDGPRRDAASARRLLRCRAHPQGHRHQL